MTFLIAAIILVILSAFFLGLRAYLGFCALVVGFAMTLTGLFGEKEMLFIGLCTLAYSILSAYFTIRKSQRGMIRLQILRFYGYGLFLFLQVTMTMLIIFASLASVCGTVAESYREVMIIDCMGREVGRTMVDSHNRGPNGERYTPTDKTLNL